MSSNESGLFRRGGGLNTPPDVLIGWPAPNYTDPEERGWVAPIALFVVLGLTFLVFLLRIWARLIVLKNAGLDDLLMALAMLPVFGLTISAVLGEHSVTLWQRLLTSCSCAILRVSMAHLGSDCWNSYHKPRSERIHLVYVFYVLISQITMAIELNYLFSTTLIKISILCFYRRMSDSLKNLFVYCKCSKHGLIVSPLLTAFCRGTRFNYLLHVVWFDVHFSPHLHLHSGRG